MLHQPVTNLIWQLFGAGQGLDTTRDTVSKCVDQKSWFEMSAYFSFCLCQQSKWINIFILAGQTCPMLLLHLVHWQKFCCLSNEMLIRFCLFLLHPTIWAFSRMSVWTAFRCFCSSSMNSHIRHHHSTLDHSSSLSNHVTRNPLWIL